MTKTALKKCRICDFLHFFDAKLGIWSIIFNLVSDFFLMKA